MRSVNFIFDKNFFTSAKKRLEIHENYSDSDIQIDRQ